MKTSAKRRANAKSPLPFAEAELVRLLVNFLSGDGYKVRLEVPNMGQSADIVATRNRWLTFVEAKIGDWRRAMGQCRAHEIVADFVCIAFPTRTIPEELHEELLRFGYGAILCDIARRRCRWLRKPLRNKKVWTPQRKRLVALMRSIQHES